MSFCWEKFLTKFLCFSLLVLVFSCQRKTQVYLHPVYDPAVTIDYRNQDVVSPSSPGIYAPHNYYQQQRPASRFYTNPYDFPSARYPNYDVEQYYRAPNAYNPATEQNNESGSYQEIYGEDLEH